MKIYPLHMRYSYGEDVTYWSKGHHDLAMFSAEVMKQQEGAQLEEPKHAWWRVVPAPLGSDFDTFLHPAKPNARGAFPVTYVELQDQP